MNYSSSVGLSLSNGRVRILKGWRERKDPVGPCLCWWSSPLRLTGLIFILRLSWLCWLRLCIFTSSIKCYLLIFFCKITLYLYLEVNSWHLPFALLCLWTGSPSLSSPVHSWICLENWKPPKMECVSVFVSETYCTWSNNISSCYVLSNTSDILKCLQALPFLNSVTLYSRAL